MEHVGRGTLEAAVEHVRGAPRDEGRLELIARRPAEDERETPHEAQLDLVEGLVAARKLAPGSA